MAEREGVEPPIPFRVCRFSRPVPSTTRPPLRLLQFYYNPQFFWEHLRAVAFILDRSQAIALSARRPEVASRVLRSCWMRRSDGGIAFHNSAAVRLHGCGPGTFHFS